MNFVHRESDLLSTFVSLLRQTTTITEKKLRSMYDIAAEEAGYELAAEVQENLISLILKNIASAAKGRELDGHNEIGFFGVNDNEEECVVVLKKVKSSKMSYDSLLNLMTKEQVDVGYLIFLEKNIIEEVRNEALLEDEGLSNLTLTSVCKEQSLHESMQEREFKDSRPEFIHNSHFRNMEKYQELSKGSPMKLSKRSTSRGDRTKARLAVIQELGDELLCNKVEKVYNKLGIFTFAEFFESLVDNPNHKINAKWIGYLKKDFSKDWTNGCWVAIRAYFNKFNH